MFSSLWAEPAVYRPAGLVPGVARLPRFLSRHPIASITAFARTLRNPSFADIMVSSKHLSPSLVNWVTVFPKAYFTPARFALSTTISAYSGPVSSFLK